MVPSLPPHLLLMVYPTSEQEIVKRHLKLSNKLDMVAQAFNPSPPWETGEGGPL